MKKIVTYLLLILPSLILAQELKLVKGAVMDVNIVNDSLQETFALYLPNTFEMSKTWPVLFVFDMKGKGKQALSMFRESAEQEGYILASSSNINDSLSISQNVLIASRMFNTVFKTLPIKKDRSYAGGFSDGARFASILPTFVKGINGVISCGAGIANVGIINSKTPFYFVGIVGREDYNFQDMLEGRKTFNSLKFPNQLIVHEGGHEWSTTELISTAMRKLTLKAMAQGIIEKDEQLIRASYNSSLNKSNVLFTQNKPLLADYIISDMARLYAPLVDLDSLKTTRKYLRRSQLFKLQNRNQNNYFLQESFTRDDYSYYLEEDIMTYNYNNLGWWTYQMEELEKIGKSNLLVRRQMGSRLKGYVNALIEDNIDAITAEKVIDTEALNFIYMLKTITQPKNYDSYLKVISNSTLMEDYGTALFYLEELLKNGYKNKTELYSLEHTALFRITPEFNEVVSKYLKESRYELMED